MRARRSLFVLLAVVAAFAAGLQVLFAERFESGDIYPAYSTLRSDPLGCRALYAALDGPLEARRAFAAADYRDPDPGAVWFFLGEPATRSGVAPARARLVDSLARQGARVVVALAPKRPGRGLAGTWSLAEADSARADSAGDTSGQVTPKIPPPRRAEIPRLGLRVARDSAWPGESPADSSAGPASERVHARGPDGDSLPILSALHFDSLDGAWAVLYRRDSLPVAVERPLGEGSLVLLADSYWASNEALYRETPGRLLALLIGRRERVIFDERHLGIAQSDSLADLLARHRLHGMLPSLSLLFLAWLWRARGAFEAAPPLPESASGAGERHGPRGMHRLLRRYVPVEGLLAACYGLWRETEGKSSRSFSRARAIEAEADRILAESSGGPAAQVEGYRRIQNLLKEGKPG